MVPRCTDCYRNEGDRSVWVEPLDDERRLCLGGMDTQSRCGTKGESIIKKLGQLFSKT